MMTHVMVVDPCERMRARILDAVRDLDGVEIRGVAYDVRGAVEVLEQTAPDVVVTAGDLDDGDGFDVLERASRRSDPPAVIVLDGTETPAHRRYILAGAELVMSRAIATHELAHALRGVIAARRKADPFALLGRLTAGVAHDLNNYLMVVDLANAQGLHDHARLAGEAAIRLNDTLLAYARGGSPPVTDVDLGALVRRVVGLFATALSERIEVVLDIDAPATITGVAAELEQVVLNLVLNAGEAMPNGGVLDIRVRNDGAMARLTVADRGSGLRARGTGPVTPSTKRDRPGGGLGLGIIRGVVARHGGVLSIAPRAGGGTEVTVLLAAR